MQVQRCGDARCPSLAEVMRLVHLVCDPRNLFAAFFLGDVAKIVGRISLAVMGSPQEAVGGDAAGDCRLRGGCGGAGGV